MKKIASIAITAASGLYFLPMMMHEAQSLADGDYTTAAGCGVGLIMGVCALLVVNAAIWCGVDLSGIGDVGLPAPPKPPEPPSW